MRVDSEDKEYAILSVAEKNAVREQLDRLLANTYFSHSRRFPSFLRFVIEHTLAGETEHIKERTLGVEIFGRDANYDTASDPIVRVTAAEIRKRVAQYYQEPSHEAELRITLPSGSYIPQFHWPQSIENGSISEPDSIVAEPSSQITVEPATESRKARRRLPVIPALACVALVAASVGAVFAWQAMRRSAFDFFWGPVLSANEPVLICIADQLQYSSISLRDAADPAHQISLKDNLTAVVIDDLNATVKVAGILQSSGKAYSLKGEGATNLADLRSGPTVFIGAFDNAWTLRLTKPLRFHFSNSAEMTQLGIVDSTAAEQTRWVVNRSVQMSTNNYRDYAIVARFTDSNTGKLAVVVAGVGRGGTIAAGEFLTDARDLVQLKRAAQAAGDKKNMEIVLSTQIIDGEPGSPKMEAAYFW
jgi:hypothetical protein